MDVNYHEFKFENEAIKWLNENYKDFITNIQEKSDINDTLGNALLRYTGSMSKNYNDILKSNNGEITGIDHAIDKYYNVDNNDNIEISLNNCLAKDAKEDIKFIYEAFKMNIINDDIILFRYFKIENFDNKLIKNNEFEINHFISTTMLKKSNSITDLINKEKYNSVLVIKVKKGTPCIPIGNNPNSILNEFEIILKPKSQFKVNIVRKKFFSKIKYVVNCELI